MAAFEHALIEANYYGAVGNLAYQNHWRSHANTIWRELKLRLVPTIPDGNPSR